MVQLAVVLSEESEDHIKVGMINLNLKTWKIESSLSFIQVLDVLFR